MCTTMIDILSQVRLLQAKCLVRSLMALTTGPDALAVSSRVAAESFPDMTADDLAAAVQADLDREADPATLKAIDTLQAELSRLNAPGMTRARLNGAHA